MGKINRIPEQMDQETVIEVVSTGEYRSKHLGLTHESARLFRIEGYGDTPHRIMVWDNTVRPMGDDSFKDPFGVVTTDKATLVVRAAPVVISKHTLARDGYSATKLHIGQTVKLIGPDGQVSGPYIIQVRSESPVLVPAS